MWSGASTGRGASDESAVFTEEPSDVENVADFGVDGADAESSIEKRVLCASTQDVPCTTLRTERETECFSFLPRELMMQ